MRVTCQEQVTANIVVIQMLQRPVSVGDVSLRNVSLRSDVKRGLGTTNIPVVSTHAAIVVFIQT